MADEQHHYFRFHNAPYSGSLVVYPPGPRSRAVRVHFDHTPIRGVPDGEWEVVGNPEPEAAAREAVAYTIARNEGRSVHPSALQTHAKLVAVRVPLLGPGEFYPRLWRPSSRWNSGVDHVLRTESRMTLRRLEKLAEQIFMVVDPSHNPTAYGHAIRQLLLLAAMEVDDTCAAIYLANCGPAQDPRPKDYFPLRDAMQLPAVVLGLSGYPRCEKFRPFDGWGPAHAAESLWWFDAYQKVKHSRTEHFGLATLTAALNALAAAWVLYAMQFGPHTLAEDSDLFRLRGSPPFDWPEGYVLAVCSPIQSAVAFPFPEAAVAQP